MQIKVTGNVATLKLNNTERNHLCRTAEIMRVIERLIPSDKSGCVADLLDDYAAQSLHSSEIHQPPDEQTEVEVAN